MKTQHTVILLFTAFLFLNLKCKKENNEPQLPPETTTGAMTFGCKVNGKVFIPRDGNGSPGLAPQYLFLGNGPGGGWWLNIPAIDWKDKKSVGIATDSLLLITGVSYSLKKLKGFAYSQYTSGLLYYQMWPNDTGELFITKHDESKRILSGRFSFTASTSAGEKVTITEGRFDIRY
jgi:hypothetical protein